MNTIKTIARHSKQSLKILLFVLLTFIIILPITTMTARAQLSAPSCSPGDPSPGCALTRCDIDAVIGEHPAYDPCGSLYGNNATNSCLCSAVSAIDSGTGSASSGGSTPIELKSLDKILQSWTSQHSGSLVSVKNIGTGDSANVGGSQSIQSASVYKLFVADALYDLKAKGKISFNSNVDIGPYAAYAKLEDGPSRDGSLDGTSYPWGSRTSIPIKECLPQMISNSENACGDALKKKVMDAGYNSFGSGTTLSPQRVSANDATNLMAQIAQGKMVSASASKDLESLLDKQAHRRKIPAGVAGISGVTVGNKTGEIWLAEAIGGKTYSHDTAIIRGPNNLIYTITVLTTLDPASATDNSAIADLSKQVYDYFTTGSATTTPGDTSSASVTGGAPDTSCLGGNISLTMPDVDPAQLQQSIENYIKNTVPGSPLLALADKFVSFGQQYNVNPALVVAIAQKETSFGTAGVGRPPQYDIGAIRGGSSGFATYSGYLEGLEAIYKNLKTSAYSSDTTVAQIITTWAPPTDNNDTAAYIQTVLDIMSKILGVNATPYCTSTSSGSSTGNVDPSGYAFPVAPQTKSGDNGVSYASHFPCSTSPPWSCHHDDTPATDIAPQPGGDQIAGTAVYAISDGTIENLHTYMNISGCYSLQLHSSKDNYYYYYTHMQGPKVQTGDKVVAGQQIAEVGPSKCTGNGSGAHLHIDRGCIVNGVPQMGGTVSCRDPGFIPLINALFGALPDR